MPLQEHTLTNMHSSFPRSLGSYERPSLGRCIASTPRSDDLTYTPSQSSVLSPNGDMPRPIIEVVYHNYQDPQSDLKGSTPQHDKVIIVEHNYQDPQSDLKLVTPGPEGYTPQHDKVIIVEVETPPNGQQLQFVSPMCVGVRPAAMLKGMSGGQKTLHSSKGSLSLADRAILLRSRLRRTL